MNIKTKLSLGTGFLFFVILLFGILSMVSIYRLKTASALVLKNNYETLVYSNNMQEALDKLNDDASFKNVFEQNLRKQQNNITEHGEKEVTQKIFENFQLLGTSTKPDSLKLIIRQELYDINKINQRAIYKKNVIAKNIAENANNWLVTIFSVLMLLSFTIAVNFPDFVTKPVIPLNKSIKDAIILRNVTPNYETETDQTENLPQKPDTV